MPRSTKVKPKTPTFLLVEDSLMYGRAESKAIANSLRAIVRCEFNWRLMPSLWSKEFWETPVLYYLWSVFLSICRFPLNERPMVMYDCAIHFRELSDLLRQAALMPSQSLPTDIARHLPPGRILTAHDYISKLKDLDNAQSAVLDGTADRCLAEWMGDQGKLNEARTRVKFAPEPEYEEDDVMERDLQHRSSKSLKPILKQYSRRARAEWVEYERRLTYIRSRLKFAPKPKFQKDAVTEKAPENRSNKASKSILKKSSKRAPASETAQRQQPAREQVYIPYSPGKERKYKPFRPGKEKEKKSSPNNPAMQHPAGSSR